MLPARIDVAYTAQELTDLDTALTTIENLLARLPVITPEDKPRIPKMPDGAWGFILNVKTLAQQNLQKLPREYEDAPFTKDVTARNDLSPRQNRLLTIQERLQNGLLLLESDCWATSLYCRRHLKDGGLAAAIDAMLDDGMRRFFDRSGEDPAPPPPTPPPA